MSAVRPSPSTPGTLLCPRCGNALREDQGWCLECGLAARTRIHPPPSWRLPVLLTCLVLALLAAGIALALFTLFDTTEPTPAATTVTVPATAPPATTPGATVPTATAPTTTATVPGATTPTVPTATTPTTATTPGAAAAPSSDGYRTITIPGTRLKIRVRVPRGTGGGTGAIK